MTNFLFDKAPITGRSYQPRPGYEEGPVVFSPQKQSHFLLDISNLQYDTRLARFVTATYKNRIDATIDQPPFALDFGELHLMTIIDLGKQLVEVRNDIVDKDIASQEQRKHVRHLLQEYSCAISNYEGMLGRKLHWATSKSPVEQILEAVVGDGFTVNMEAGRLFHGWHTLQDLKDTEANARKRKWRAGAERFGMAIIGGVLLVVPVVIMSFNTSRTKSLITLSASVLVFAFVVAGGADKASPQEVIGATAAYAAVLAVFLGASAGSPTGT